MFRIKFTTRFHQRAVGFLLIFLCAGSLIAQKQVPIEPIRLRIISYSGLMIPLLSEMARTYRVVIGLEVDPQDRDPTVTFELHDPSIEDVLNTIVTSRPQYQWRRDGALMNVLPINDASPLLETFVEDFQVKDVTESEAIDQLLSRPEVKATMLNADLHRAPAEGSAQRNQTKFSLALSRVTVREALNRITIASGSQFWVFRGSGSKVRVFTITTSVSPV
jgi:hypothetical protein